VALTPDMFASLVEKHESSWDRESNEHKRMMALYETRYWKREELDPTSLVIETSRAFEFIEGFQASLFSREPSIEATQGARGKGAPEVAKLLVDDWFHLSEVHETVEEASAMALIYPCAFFKVFPGSGSSDVDVQVEAVAPWDVLLDQRAKAWDRQRFIAHRRVMPASDAAALFKTNEDELGSDERREYGEQVSYISPEDKTDCDPHVDVWEVYDIQEDKVYWWTHRNATEWMATSKSIPFRDSDNDPMVPIIPFYYGYVPGKRLRGMSSLRRISDQIIEINMARTYQANAVRKMARQWIARKGVLDEGALGKLAQGVDGETVEVDVQPGVSMTDVIVAVPHEPMRAESEVYIRQVQSDLDRGSVMAPFTRGTSTNVTASEITALAAYTASEVGRLARRRDAAIVRLARVYLSVLAAIMPDAGHPIIKDGEEHVVKPAEIVGDFHVVATDGGATPASSALQSQKFISALPTLQALGVPKDVLLSQLVRSLGLDPAIVDAAEAAAQQVAQAPPPIEAGAAESGSLGLGAGEQASPEQVAQVLPPGGVV
jgi:hypothetical protein